MRAAELMDARRATPGVSEKRRFAFLSGLEAAKSQIRTPEGVRWEKRKDGRS
jgi:hypothetical protein